MSCCYTVWSTLSPIIHSDISYLMQELYVAQHSDFVKKDSLVVPLYLYIHVIQLCLYIHLYISLLQTFEMTDIQTYWYNHHVTNDNSILFNFLLALTQMW